MFPVTYARNLSVFHSKLSLNTRATTKSCQFLLLNSFCAILPLVTTANTWV